MVNYLNLQDSNLQLDVVNLPTVLVVDDDTGCREEYVCTLAELGYEVCAAADAIEALCIMTVRNDIGVVLTDIRMPRIDGLTLLREIEARFGPDRPVAAIVITAYASPEIIVDSLRAEAVDFLLKPLERADLSSALQRAAVRWGRNQNRKGEEPSAESKENVSRIFDLLANERKAPSDRIAPSDDQLIACLKWLIRIRQQRSKILINGRFSDPSWDILLDLALARLEGTAVSASTASLAAGIPLSTAMRRVTEMVQAGLVNRWNDPEDKRRDLIDISDHAMEQMREYLRHVINALDANKISNGPSPSTR